MTVCNTLGAGAGCGPPLTFHNGDRDKAIALFDGIDNVLSIALHLAKDRMLAI